MANKMADKKRNASRSRMAEVKPRSSESTKEQPAKVVKTMPREERKVQLKQESKAAVRRETKGSSSLATRLRSNRLGRFILDAYYELRYKVTWPTFLQARNMTIVVIILSIIIGGILAAIDFGLDRLFLFMSGK